MKRRVKWALAVGLASAVLMSVPVMAETCSHTYEDGTSAWHEYKEDPGILTFGYYSKNCDICGEYTYQVSDPLPTPGHWESNAKGWWYALDNPDEVWSDTPYFASRAAYCDNGVYVFDVNGYMQTGWQCITYNYDDGSSWTEWYYCDESGRAVTGWKKLNGKWYYLDEYRRMATGWWWINDVGYYFNKDGSLADGWIDLSVGDTNEVYWAYGTENGVAVGWNEINGVWYYFDEYGWMLTDWVFDGYNWYYMNGSGAMQTGWISDNTGWYYLNDSGKMQTGWCKVDGTWYYLNGGSGVMETGWVFDGYNWYYMNGSGAMQTGWINDGTAWYYLYESGAMAANTTIDGYQVGANGAWVQ